MGTIIVKPKYWTPQSLGSHLALWLDAYDVSLNGSNVSQWNDKSGNNKHAIQATAALQPEYLATGFNGKPTLNFDATDDVFFITGTSANAGDDFFIGSVFAFIYPVGSWSMIAGFRDTANAIANGQPVLQRISSLNALGYHNSDVTANAIQVDVTSIAGNTIATVGRSGGSNGQGGTSIVTATGTTDNYLTTATQTWVSTSGNNFQIAGRQQPNTAYGQKQISEVILCNRNLTTEERQKYEGYLAHKWGLVDSLPIDHPYKNRRPRG